MTHTGLVLNTLEIITSKEDVSIFMTIYKDDTLKKYQNSFQDYYFYRFENAIYSWQLKETSDVLPNEFSRITISKNNHTLVFNKILEMAIVQWLKNNNSNIYKLKNSSVWEVVYKSESKRSFSGLSIYPTFHFSTHPFYSYSSNKLITALSIRYTTKFVFEASEEELSSMGFDTRFLTKNIRGKLIASTNTVKKFLEATGQTYRFNEEWKRLNKEDNLFREMKNIMSAFNNKFKNRSYLPDNLSILGLNLHNIPNSNFASINISKPKYFFYQDRLNTGLSYDIATKELKPYSFDSFKNRSIKILIISPNIYEGSVELFKSKIKKKILEVFHIQEIQFTNIIFDINKSYTEAIDNFSYEEQDLAIIVVSANDKRKEIKESPYYLTKAKMLNQKIPTQEVTIEIIRSEDEKIDKAIALNIYSKIGGMAWAVDKIDKGKLEIVIGISSIITENQRVMGFANIFDFNGTYLLGDCSTLSSMDNYANDLKTYLIKSIRELILSKQIETGESIRLIFHLFKEASKEHELKAIQQTLEEFSAYDIQFSIVHLSYNHNLRLFQDEGKTSVQRGTYIQVSTLQAVLHMGNQTKVPILVRLDRRSTYKDLFDTCKQVIYFCHLCYRSFRPSNVPVTIKYPSLMAKLAFELKQVPDWDKSQMNKIKNKLWFI